MRKNYLARLKVLLTIFLMSDLPVLQLGSSPILPTPTVKAIVAPPMAVTMAAPVIKPPSASVAPVARNNPDLGSWTTITFNLPLERIIELRRRWMETNTIQINEHSQPILGGVSLGGSLAESLGESSLSGTDRERSTRAPEKRITLQKRRTRQKISRLMTCFAGSHWPTASPYRCWCCHYRFETAPIGIPERIDCSTDELGMDKLGMEMDKSRVKETFWCYGNFCSFRCARHYLIHDLGGTYDRCSDDMRQDRLQLLHLLKFRETGDDRIEECPSLLALREYGGFMEIEDWRAEADPIRIFKSPLAPIVYQSERMIRRS